MILKLKPVTAPAIEPVGIEEMKQYLRVEHDDDDRQIDSMTKAARLWCENFSRRAFIDQTWDLSLDAFPPGDDPIDIPLPPLDSITSIKYTDTDGAPQTVDDAQTDDSREPGQIVPAYAVVWPATRAVPNAVVIRFKAGYGTAKVDVPENFRNAVMGMTKHLYDGCSVGEPPNFVLDLLDMDSAVRAL